MREFIVTLKCGQRYTVKAERMRGGPEFMAFLVGPPSAAPYDPFEGVVALFEQRQVAVVIVRDHLVSEEKGKPVDPYFVAADGDEPIPF